MPQRSYVLQIITEFQNKAGAGLAGLTQSLSGVGKVAAGATVAGLAVAGAALVGLGAASVAANAEFEQSKTRFTTLLGSATAAEQRMKELAEFGKSTPFDLPGVIDADTILQGFGFHSQEAAQQFGYSGAQIREIAGDVSSGTKASFSEMALILGKFSKGATGEAIARMQELGITSRDELGKMGVQFSKSGELLSPLPQAMNTVLSMMKEKYGGLMQAQSQTFSGMLSNLRDWAGQTVREMGKPIFDAAKIGLKGLLDALSSPAMQAAIQSLAGALADFTTGMIDGLRIVGDTMREIGLSENFNALISTITGGRQVTIDWGNEARTFALELGNLFIQVNDGVQRVVILLRGSGTVVSALRDLVAIGLAGAWNLTTTSVIGSYHAAMAFDAAVRGNLLSALSEFGSATTAVNAVQTALNNLRTVGGDALLALGADAAELRRQLDGVTQSTALAQARLRNRIAGAGLAGLDASDLAAEKRDMRLLKGQSAVAADVKQVWTAAGNDAASSWEKAFDQAASYIEGALSNAQNALKGLAPADFFKDMFAPGGNGPFENIFRAMDVAVHGADSPWAAALGLDQATAKQIVDKFNQGIMDEQVKGLINIPALVDAAKMAAAAEQSKKLFVAEIAKQAGVSPTAVEALMGVGGGANQAVGNGVTALATDMKTAFDGQGQTFQDIGGALLTKISDGLNGMKDTLLSNLRTNVIDPMVSEFDRATSAVERLIAALERLARTPASPPAPPGTGTGVPTRARVYAPAPVYAGQAVRVTQNFYGPADRQVVRQAARDGIDDLRRARGYR